MSHSRYPIATRLARISLAILIPILLLSLIALGAKASSAKEPAKSSLPARSDPPVPLQADAAAPGTSARLVPWSPASVLADVPLPGNFSQPRQAALWRSMPTFDVNSGPASWGVTSVQADAPAKTAAMTPPRASDKARVARPFLMSPCGDYCVVTTSMTLTAGTHNFTALTVTNNATLTLQGDPSTGKGVTITAQTIFVDSGATIAATGGYGANQGPGTPGSCGGNCGGSGAGYGGYGGLGQNSNPGGRKPYGDLYQPVALGSGGRTGLNGTNVGGAGGGAVHLIVTDTLTLNGTLSANGKDGGNIGGFYSSGGGGGAGGSIWIETSAMTGTTGIVRANGGKGGTAPTWDGGGGAGGRIAVYGDTSDFSGDIQAYSGSGYNYGGPGTIYLESEDKLLVDNDNHDSVPAAILTGTYQFSTTELTRFGHLVVLGDSSHITLTNDTLVGDGSSRLIVSGTIAAPMSFTIEDATIAVAGRLSNAQVITTADDGGLELYASTPWHTGIYTYDRLYVGTGTTVTMISRIVNNSIYTDDYGVELRVDDLTIATSGTLTANGRGYGAGQGPGKPGSCSSNCTGAGAGHGGYGGTGSSGSPLGGAPYGDLYHPTHLGSGGRSGNSTAGGGGGAVHLIITGTFTLNGALSANGGNGIDDSWPGDAAGGGGSGGSLWIETSVLTGTTGSIRANGGRGGNASKKGGGGAGGRIAVYASTNNFGGEIQANGGSGYVSGGAGTLYLDAVDSLSSTLEAWPHEDMVANGVATSTITVTLVTTSGFATPGKTVLLEITGTGNLINGTPITQGVPITVGVSDSDGIVTATLASTKAETKEVSAWAEDIRLVHTALVTFTAGPMDAQQSQVWAVPTEVAADGTATATVHVQVYDAYANAVPSVTVTLSDTGSSTTLTQPATPTGADGQTWGALSGAQPEVVTVTATADGVLLSDTAQVTFEVSDIAVTKVGSDQVLAGQRLTYTLGVANDGLISAQGVVLTDTLPAGAVFFTQTSNLTFTQMGQTLTWQVGELAGGEYKPDFSLVVTVPATTTEQTQLVNHAAASTTSQEQSTANNTATVTTTVFRLPPALAVTPSYSELDVQRGATQTLVLTAKSEDTIIITNVVASAPAHLAGWVSVSPTAPFDLAPNQSAALTLTLAPPAELTRGTYRDLVTVETDGTCQSATLSARVVDITRTLVITVHNSAGQAVPQANIRLVQQVTRPLVTEGVTVTLHPEFETQTDEDGQATLAALEANTDEGEGVYQYLVWKPGDGAASGVLTVTNEPGPQSLTITPTGQATLVLEPLYPKIYVRPGKTDAYQVIIHNTGPTTATHVQVETPEALPWLYASVTGPANALGVGQALSVTVFASPPATLTAPLEYQQAIEVVADNTMLARFALTARIGDLRVYDHGVDCTADITDTQLALPYQKTVYGPFTIGDLGPWKTLFICTGGGDFYVDMKAKALGAQVDDLGVELISISGQTPQVHIAPAPVIYWKHQCLGPVDSHQEVEYAGEQFLPAGAYRVSLAARHLFTWCTPKSPFSQIYLDIDSSHSPDDQTLAPDSPCLLNNGDKYAAGLGNTRTGNLTHQEVDVSIPALGEALTFERSYNALDSASSSLGRGWTHNYNMRLFTEYGNLVVVAPRGSRLYFAVEADGTFTPRPGVHASLRRNADATYTLTRGDQLVYTFDNDGRLSQIADSNGNATTLVYSGTLLTQAAAPGGRLLNFSYDAQGRLTQVTDPLSRTFTYEYTDVTFTPLGGSPIVLYSLLTSVLDPLAHPLTYTYDADGYLAGITDAQRHTVNNAYEAIYGRLITQTDPMGHGTFFAFDDGAHQTTVADPRGNRTGYAYDNTGGLRSVTDPLGNVTRYEHDENYNLQAVTDPLSHTTRMAWKECRPTLITDALAYTTTMSYDDLNNLRVITNAQGFTTTYFYSGTLLTKTVDALGHTTLYTYSASGGDIPAGLLLAQRDAGGRVTRYDYDPFGQRTVITAPGELVMRYGYDAAGRLITTTAPGGIVTVNDYDAADHLIHVTRNYTTAGGQNYLDEYNLMTWYGYDSAGRQTAVTDTLGRVALNGYDAGGQLISTTVNYTVTHPQQNYLNQYNLVTRYGYDDAGNQTLITDTLGYVTKTDYDALNRPATVTANYKSGGPWDAQTNLTRTTGYDAAGNVVTRTDTLGHQTVTGYDPLNRPVTVTRRAEGGAWSVESVTAYDEVGNATARQDAAGHWTYYEYDELGRLVTTTNALSGTTVTVYNAAGQPSQTQDPRGNWTWYEYDPTTGRLVTVTNALSGTTVTVYDALGRRAASQDVLGHTTVYTYSPTGQLTATADPGGAITRYAYDALGRTVLVTDALTHTTRMQYNALGRVVTTTRSVEGGAWSAPSVTQYDALGRQSQMQDARGNWTTFEYDALGRVITTTDATSRTMVTVYDRAGNRVETQLCGPGAACLTQAHFDYDDWGRLIAQTDALTHTTQYAYDEVGSRLVMTDANGLVTRYGYDPLSRLITVTENYSTGPTDHQTNVTPQYGYDAVGNRIAVTNALTHTTVYTYDALSRLIATSDPLVHTTHYSYDAVGNRTVLTDANGEVTRYAYDAANRPLIITYTADSTTVEYRYDKLGNRTAMTDSTGVTTYVYDALYRPMTITSPYTGTVGYRYDEAGNRTQLIYPGGQVVTYTYDDAHRLTNAEDWDGQDTTYEYNAYGRLVTTTLPNSVATHYSYDAAGRLVMLQHVTPTGSLAVYTYTLDAVGNRLRAGEYRDLPLSDTRIITYTYDPLNRLTAADYSTGESFAYVYDAVGNRTAYTQTITDTLVTTYTYDAANRLTSVDGQAYTWDANGNLTSDGSKTYTYNQANQLTGISATGLTWSTTYNGDGARRKQTMNGTVTTYTLDLAAPLVTVLIEQQATSNQTYLYAQGDSPIASYDGADWTYLSGRDGLGSVRQETDADGNVLTTRSFDPYGVVMQGNGGSPFGYTGEVWDNATSLVFLRARMYQPTLGIFFSPDPWVGNPSRPNTLHKFSYAADNPVLFVDHSGRSVECNRWWPLGFDLVSLCKQADQDLQSAGPSARENILDAREQLYYRVADIVGRVPPGILYMQGAPYVKTVLLHFLEGSGDLEFPMTAFDPFPLDPGITRATKYFRPPSYIGDKKDEPDIVFPLLHDFMVNYVKPVANSDGLFQVGPTPRIKGQEGGHYFNVPPRARGDTNVRPYDTGFWAAFGHVSVDGIFYAEGRKDCSNSWNSYFDGYIIDYKADYYIEDEYKWYADIMTWFPIIVAPLPDAWAKSLAEAGRAHEYHFSIYWTERDQLYVDHDFTRYREWGVVQEEPIYQGFVRPR